MSPNITRMESLQCRATKFILDTHWQDDISYHERLSRLKLLPLTYGHEVKDLIFHFKCRVGHSTLPIDDYVKPKGTRPTRPSSDEDVLIPKCRTKIFQFSYFNRIAKLWNTLSESTRTLTSLNQFKSHVLQRYRLLFVQTITSLTLTPEVDLLQMSRPRNLLLAGNCCY